MRFRLGLTGSIGMGKTTTAQMFLDAGCKVWDADRAVHRLYAPGGAAVAQIGEAFPDAIQDAAVSRAALRRIIAADPSALARIEVIVHPLVHRDRVEFAARHVDKVGVFDIPLLFETGGDVWMDAVVCVTVAPDVQRARVLERGGMTAEDLDRILARQMPIADKIARSDYVIETDTLEHARAQVHSVLADIERRIADA